MKVEWSVEGPAELKGFSEDVRRMKYVWFYAGLWAQAIQDSGSADDKQALQLAVALSQRSNHPVSRALTSLDGLLDKSGGGVSHCISDFRAVPGAHAP